MPAAVLVPLITAAASSTAAVVGAKMSSNASKRASDVTSQANAQATKLATDQEAERRREFDAQQAEAKKQWDAAEANKAPYRAASQAALMKLSDLYGFPAPSGGNGSAMTATRSDSNIPSLGASFDPAKAEALYRTAYTDNRPFDASYWARQWPGLVARGQELNDPQYAEKRLLGWQAGGADVATAGPFAGARGNTMPAQPPAMNAAASTYQPIIPFRQLMT
jgi:hypothetical protein